MSSRNWAIAAALALFACSSASGETTQGASCASMCAKTAEASCPNARATCEADCDSAAARCPAQTSAFNACVVKNGASCDAIGEPIYPACVAETSTLDACLKGK